MKKSHPILRIRFVVLLVILSVFLCSCSGNTQENKSNTGLLQLPPDTLVTENGTSSVVADETKPAPTEAPTEKTTLPVPTTPTIGFITTDFSVTALTGQGTYVWKSGDRYVGEWVDGVFSGQGEYTWANGDTYSGSFDSGLPNGTGTITFANDCTYSGTFLNGSYEGEGTFRFPYVGEYSGSFSGSKRNGSGSFAWNTGEVYEGNWENDAISGNGKLTLQDGTVYEGNFVNGTLNGQKLVNQMISGKYRFADNTDNTQNPEFIIEFSDYSTYQGEIQDNKFHGTGVFRFSNGTTLEGQFAAGVFVSGTYTTKINYNTCVFTVQNGNITSAEIKYTNGNTYVGDFANGSVSGKGVMKYSNGDNYTGDFQNGLKHGTGTYTWSGGAKYEGSWKDDKMDGKGTYFYPSWAAGVKLVGTFKDGKPNGTCEYYLTETKHYKTDWENGACKKTYE